MILFRIFLIVFFGGLLTSLRQPSCSSFAQSLSQVKPIVVKPGKTNALTLIGKGLEPPLRIRSNVKADFTIESVTAEKAVIQMTLPQQTQTGPIGVWLASKSVPISPFVLFVEDINPVEDQGNNHSVETAQPILPPIAVMGTSDGFRADYFKFHVEKPQRLAFEVRTLALGSTMDPVIRLFDSSGRSLYVVDDDEIGPEPRVSHRFEEAGDYWIEVQDNQYSKGGRYLLRVGDFPLIAHSIPLAVQRGVETEIHFESLDDGEISPVTTLLDDESSSQIVHVSSKLSGGQSSSTARLRVSDFPVRMESDLSDIQDSESQGSTIAVTPPVIFSGTLNEPSQLDSYLIQGVKNKAFRFSSSTRSLGSRALLRMKLYRLNGALVAQSDVSSRDEWFFDYEFPDDGQYRLVVDDLVQRGGEGFGYLVEISEKSGFALEWKPDPKSPEHFLIDQGSGACALTLQVLREGYEGAIDLSLHPADIGLKIVDPIIPAGAKEKRVLIAATDAWNSDSAITLRIEGQARDGSRRRVMMSSLALHRAKQPHVPFPEQWNDGVGFFVGRDQSEEYFRIESKDPIVFAKPIKTHTVDLSLTRLNEKFKGAVELFADPSSSDFKMTSKTEGDIYHVTFNRDEVTQLGDQVEVLTYSEFAGGGQLVSFHFPIQWIDPIQVSLKSTDPPVAGKLNEFALSVLRQGSDPQPATIKLTQVPKEWGVSESFELGLEQETQDLKIEIPDSYSETSGVIRYELTSEYQGSEFTITGDLPVQGIVPAPVKLMAYPERIEFDGLTFRQQIVITGHDTQGALRDWTRDAVFQATDTSVVEVTGSVIHAKSDGVTQLRVNAGGKELLLPIEVRNSGVKQPIRFESDVLAALSKQGCNSGACHGSPSGKGMFRLSLRAFDKKLDELTLIREDFGRRLNLVEPEESLLLLKPLMKINHGGGKKLHESDPAYTILRNWIAGGAAADAPGTPRCVRLEVYPHEKRLLSLDGGRQQLAATAWFADGSRKDVTALAVYESSDTSVAEVDETGLIRSVGVGEAVILVRFLEHIESIPVMFIEDDADYRWASEPPLNYIDGLVDAKLKQLQYSPSPVCSDSEFIRRVYLDLLGVLPSVSETRLFLNDATDDKRGKLIDELLERGEYAKFWALKWGDLLKMTKKDVGDAGVFKYHRWVEEALRSNLPYDQFVRELLGAKGSTLANPPANFYRTAKDMNECVETVSQVFMGARMQCAKCHNHPFERWTQDNYYGLGAFFNRVQRRSTQRPDEMFIWTSDTGEVSNPRTGNQMKPWLPEQGELELGELDDRRDALVQWLVQPDNPFFARIEVNRIWSQFFSRGIVEPVDDFRDSNPPSNQPLLDALAAEFVQSGFNRKEMIRTILNSRTYQASSKANESNRNDDRYFSHQRPRMLGAEQLLDAVNHTTGLEQKLGNLPIQTKATQIPAPDLVAVDFLKVFGQPERSTVCACERMGNSNLGMAIELFNGKTLHEKLADPKNRFRSAVDSGASVESIIEELYLAAVCRTPSKLELEAAVTHCSSRDQPVEGLEDVYWALLNTDEFLFQH